MFVDEVGHADLKACADPNGRYLSLTGVIFDLSYYEKTVERWVERLKAKHFEPLPTGKPLILHRKELVNKNWPFAALRDREREAAFNEDLLTVLRELDYTVLSVAIDKLEHVNRYAVWRHHPYHYCQEVLLERFAMWLRRRNAQGNVYAESRGRRDDRELKRASRFIYQHGTSFLGREVLQSVLSTEDVKVFPKSQNVAGLQFADLVAHPSFKRMMARAAGRDLPENFGGKIATILETQKYDRSPSGRIEGWGCKWLP